MVWPLCGCCLLCIWLPWWHWFDDRCHTWQLLLIVEWEHYFFPACFAHRGVGVSGVKSADTLDSDSSLLPSAPPLSLPLLFFPFTLLLVTSSSSSCPFCLFLHSFSSPSSSSSSLLLTILIFFLFFCRLLSFYSLVPLFFLSLLVHLSFLFFVGIFSLPPWNSLLLLYLLLLLLLSLSLWPGRELFTTPALIRGNVQTQLFWLEDTQWVQHFLFHYLHNKSTR